MIDELNRLVQGKSTIVMMTTPFARVATVDHPPGAESRVPSPSSGLNVGRPWHNHGSRSTRNARALAGLEAKPDE